MRMESHRFFCLNCGRENTPIFRKVSHQYKRFHRKRLYCPWCKTECNAIECRSEEEVEMFYEAFNAGEFKEEAEASMNFIKFGKV